MCHQGGLGGIRLADNKTHVPRMGAARRSWAVLSSDHDDMIPTQVPCRTRSSEYLEGLIYLVRHPSEVETHLVPTKSAKRDINENHIY